MSEIDQRESHGEVIDQDEQNSIKTKRVSNFLTRSFALETQKNQNLDAKENTEKAAPGDNDAIKVAVALNQAPNKTEIDQEDTPAPELEREGAQETPQPSSN